MLNRFFIIILIFSSFQFANAQFEGGVFKPNTKNADYNAENDLNYRYSAGISASNLRTHLSIIASDSLEGRDVGTVGIQKAEDYILKRISNLGLNSFSYNNFLQNVAFTTQRWIDTDVYVDGEWFKHFNDYLAFPDKNDNKELIRDKEVIFVGYGIEDTKYNDYKKANIENKIVIILEGEPKDKKGNYIVSGTTEPSIWSKDIDKKLFLAKAKGAQLVLVVSENFEEFVKQNRNQFFRGHTTQGDVSKSKSIYPNHIYISSKLYKALLNKNRKQESKVEKALAKGKTINAIFPCDFIVNLAREDKVISGNNVIGYVQGKTKPEEFIVVSAHFDHVGRKGDEIFNGADDNGSGTVALFELARAFQQSVLEANRPERSVVFIWLTAEEKGLLGSKYYVDNPLFPLENAVANINIDMIGRRADSYESTNEDYLFVIGSDRLSKGLHNSIINMNEKYGLLTLDLKYNDAKDPNMYYFRSDHYNFAKKGIPSVFYFNGTHADYHKGTDTVDKIDFDLMAKRTKHIFNVLWDLANREDRITVDVEQE